MARPRRCECSRVKAQEIGQRRCLKCAKLFLSQGAGNRICSACARENAKLYRDTSRLARAQLDPRVLDSLVNSDDPY